MAHVVGSFGQALLVAIKLLDLMVLVAISDLPQVDLEESGPRS